MKRHEAAEWKASPACSNSPIGDIATAADGRQIRKDFVVSQQGPAVPLVICLRKLLPEPNAEEREHCTGDCIAIPKPDRGFAKKTQRPSTSRINVRGPEIPKELEKKSPTLPDQDR